MKKEILFNQLNSGEKMKKYIRFKNGIIESNRIEILDKQHVIIYDDDDRLSWSVNKLEAIKESDNLSDLCDGFWWENQEYGDPVFVQDYQTLLNHINGWKKLDRETGSDMIEKTTVYGSIYEKGIGWIHVVSVDLETGKLSIIHKKK